MVFSLCGALRQPVVMLSLGLLTPSANALQWQWGEVEGQLDSSLSVSTAFSTTHPSAALENSANSDDGRRNFRAGDEFSRLYRGTHDLELRRGDMGLVLRGTYWYDAVLQEQSQRFKDVDNQGRDKAARSSGAQWLDAFGYYRYDVSGQPGSARLGRQVVNWSESTFIQGGLNVINPFNQSAIRRPGAEVKDALVPVNLFYLTQNITENLSFDAFYQLGWEKTQLDNCGTFFSSNDFISPGCSGLDVGAQLRGNAAAVAGLTPFGVNLTEEGIRISRASDDDPRDSGQFGAALHWYVGALDTEFGVYAANYHSRVPYLGTVSSPYYSNTGFASGLCSNIGVARGGCSAFLSSANGQSLVAALRLGTSRYLAQYPEDIHLLGVSFATTLRTGTALQGELSYRPNMPVQLNGNDLIQSLINASRSPLNADGLRPDQDSTLYDGYRRKPVTQVQVSAIHVFSQVMGANQLVLVGEAGVTHVARLEGRDGARYGRSGTFGSGELANNALCLASSKTPDTCNDDGFVTPFAWGYRLRATWTYPNVFAGVDLRPSLSWSHDVKGTSPAEGSAFSEGNKAISVGVDAALSATYTASISYTNYVDGDYGIRGDRDYVALGLGVTF